MTLAPRVDLLSVLHVGSSPPTTMPNGDPLVTNVALWADTSGPTWRMWDGGAWVPFVVAGGQKVLVGAGGEVERALALVGAAAGTAGEVERALPLVPTVGVAVEVERALARASQLTVGTVAEVERALQLVQPVGAAVEVESALTVGSGAFSPDDITGLSSWLQADAITGLSDTDPVTTWEDLSPLGIDWTEATNPPTYHTNVQNGLPAVRFDSDFDILVAGSHPLSGASAGTLFLVLSNSDGSTNAGHPSDDWGSGTSQSHYPFGGNIYDTFGTTSRKNTGSVAAGTIEAWHIYEVTSAAGYWESWINGTSRFTTASNTVGWNANPPQLGAPHDVVPEWPGDIGEVVAYDSDLSSADRTDVRNYLADRWGITL